jgi:hypothetical protein
LPPRLSFAESERAYGPVTVTAANTSDPHLEEIVPGRKARPQAHIEGNADTLSISQGAGD